MILWRATMSVESFYDIDCQRVLDQNGIPREISLKICVLQNKLFRKFGDWTATKISRSGVKCFCCQKVYAEAIIFPLMIEFEKDKIIRPRTGTGCSITCSLVAVTVCVMNMGVLQPKQQNYTI